MKRFAFVFVALTGCALPTTSVKQPQISIEHPVCITVEQKLDGKMQAWQTSDQDLFTVVGKLEHPTQDIPTLDRATMTVCYKGRQ